MELVFRGTVAQGQDGAVWGDFLFRFDHKGDCYVYDLTGEDIPEVGSFRLDRWETLCPHSNSVTFGSEYYASGDEFPLLYSNIYNNYAKAEDRLEGVCCVYRIFRDEAGFHSRMVQTIRVGFADDDALWGIGENIRPYGNFAVDREKGILYGFTMLDAQRITRYFAFPLPKSREGALWNGIPQRLLTADDILFSFDCPYHQFVQGACVHKGLIWSLEGFTNNKEHPPAFRIIDPEARCQKDMVLCADLGTNVEPECIDFQGETCWYSDAHGGLYNLIC